MTFPQRFFSLYTHHRAIVALLVLTAVLEILFILRLVFPAALAFVIENHVFEIVVLLAISQIILLLFKVLEKTPRGVCKDEHECGVVLREVVRSDPRAHSLQVLSAGLGSRLDLLTTIHRETPRTFSVEVLAQSPEHAPDREDARRMESNLEILRRDHSEAPLEVRLFDTPAAIRALLVCDRNRSPLWGAASWYRYEKAEGERVRVVGRRNPAILLRTEDSKEDAEMLRFLMGVFEQTWETATIQHPSASPPGREPE